jgi:hypothetical protein
MTEDLRITMTKTTPATTTAPGTTGPPDTAQVALELAGISKSFGPVRS